MRRMVASLMIVMVVVVVATLPHAGAIDCYACEGFNPTATEDTAFNNKFCPQESFDPKKVGVSRGGFCFAEVREHFGHKVTKRGIGLGTKMTRDTTATTINIVTFSGYYCNTSLCNAMDPSSTTPTADSSSYLTPHLLLILLLLMPVSHYLL